MLKITIESNEIIVDNSNLPDELKNVFEMVLNRMKNIEVFVITERYHVKGKREDLYSCLFNLSLIFDIELW